ncbi:MAG: kelch repeat-containing protein [Flavobacteriales bacterium]
MAPLPATPRQYCSAFVDEGGSYGYLFGGLDANGPLNELWRYDPAVDSWLQMASLPDEPRYATVAFNGGYIATGLFADGSATSELWKYSSLTDSWQQLASMPSTPRHRACKMNMGNMVVGGADADFNALADCWSYNAQTDIWTASSPLPEGRYGAMCGFAAFEMLLIGGATDASSIVETALWYNTAQWVLWADPHPGGTRRGGIMVEGASSSPGVWHTYIGLGLSNDLERHNDWYIINGAFGIPEVSLGKLAVHPNPTSDLLRPELPKHWPNAVCLIRDALGRSVLELQVQQGSNLDVHAIPAGRYELWVEFGDERLRAPFVKLP